jgi:hypothetical protein
MLSTYWVLAHRTNLQILSMGLICGQNLFVVRYYTLFSVVNLEFINLEVMVAFMKNK